jgi:hypothetical protein
MYFFTPLLDRTLGILGPLSKAKRWATKEIILGQQRIDPDGVHGNHGGGLG